MKSLIKAFIGIFLSVLLVGIVSAQEKDVEGSRDHPLLTRMKNFYISGYEELDYESHNFYDDEDNEYIDEGHKWVIKYTLKEGVRLPGQLKVRRYYANAIKMIGGVLLVKQGRYMKVTKDGKEAWIDVWVDDDGSDYRLTIVERTIMEQEVVADPNAMAGDIKATRHVNKVVVKIRLVEQKTLVKQKTQFQQIEKAKVYKPKNYIEIELVDKKDKPIPNLPYRITDPNGEVISEGKLDENGSTRLEDLPQGECDISFPGSDFSAGFEKVKGKKGKVFFIKDNEIRFHFKDAEIRLFIKKDNNK